MGLSETWIDIGCYGFPCLLWALRAGKLCSACYGQELVIRVWALCGLSCPGLIMLFLGRVLTCCSFTELCHFVAVAHPLAQEFTFPPELSVNNNVQRPRAETASSGLAIHPGPRQGSVNCVHVPGSIQVLESMGIAAQCFRLACRLRYICRLCGVSYPGGEIYVCS